MGLFDKKYCSICGSEIKLLGNRKLDDGNMCKNCASKLSPWFSGRRHTSVKAIKEQLAYREDNEKKLASFKPNKILGKRYKLYIDEESRQFIVSSSSKWQTTNPDLIRFEDVKDIIISVDEDQTELYDTDEEGKRISFDPPQYEYSYEFKVQILVNHPFFDEMTFELTDTEPDSPYSDLYNDYIGISEDIMSTILGREFQEDRSRFNYPAEEVVTTISDEWYCPKCGTKNNDNFCTKCGTAKPVTSQTVYCPKCGNKIDSPDTFFCPKCGTKVR